MALASYSDLQSSVASWLHRSDLTSVIPDFIALAEARMVGDIKSRQMETKTTLTCVAGAATVALPDDFTEMRRLMVVGNPNIVLEYKTPDQLAEDNGYATYTAIPTNFTVAAANIELNPVPDANYSLEMIYLQAIPPLSVSNTSNWVLENFPNAYLFGSLVASAAYTQDESRLAVWETKYREAVEDINSINWYSGTTPRVRSR